MCIRDSGNLDRRAAGHNLAAAGYAVGGTHRHGAHVAAAEVLLHLQHQFALRRSQGQGFIDFGELPFGELHVDDHATNGGDFACCHVLCLPNQTVVGAVSYTHLDVYKRQLLKCS